MNYYSLASKGQLKMKSYALPHVRDTQENPSTVLPPYTLPSDAEPLPGICAVLLEPGRSPAQNLTFGLHAQINTTAVIPEHLVNLVEVFCGNWAARRCLQAFWKSHFSSQVNL